MEKGHHSKLYTALGFTGGTPSSPPITITVVCQLLEMFFVIQMMTKCSRVRNALTTETKGVTHKRLITSSPLFGQKCESKKAYKNANMLSYAIILSLLSALKPMGTHDEFAIHITDNVTKMISAKVAMLTASPVSLSSLQSPFTSFTSGSVHHFIHLVLLFTQTHSSIRCVADSMSEPQRGEHC